MLLMLKCLVIVIGGKRCGRHDDRGIVFVVNELKEQLEVRRQHFLFKIVYRF